MPPLQRKEKIWCKEHLAPLEDTYKCSCGILVSSPPSCVQLDLLLAASSHKTFRVKWFLAKNQSKIFLFPQQIKMKTGNRTGTTPREDIGAGQAGSVRSPTHEANTYMLCQGHVSSISLWEHHYLNNWMCSFGEMIFSLCQCFCTLVLWLSSKYVDPFVGRKKNDNMTFSFTILPEASSCGTCTCIWECLSIQNIRIYKELFLNHDEMLFITIKPITNFLWTHSTNFHIFKLPVGLFIFKKIAFYWMCRIKIDVFYRVCAIMITIKFWSFSSLLLAAILHFLPVPPALGNHWPTFCVCKCINGITQCGLWLASFTKHVYKVHWYCGRTQKLVTRGK